MPCNMPVYDRDGITLYNDDCRNVLPILPSETFDMVITDPPYLVSYSGRWGSDWGIIEGDSDPTWVEPVFAEIARVLNPDSLCLSFYGWPHTDISFSAWRKAGLRPVSAIVCEGSDQSWVLHPLATRTRISARETE